MGRPLDGYGRVWSAPVVIDRIAERLVSGGVEAAFVPVALSVALFLVAAGLWFARRVRSERQRRTTTRS